jgi:uncharacterized protein YehS (DUF1456 family)
VIDSTREEAIVDEAQKNRLLVLNQITVIKSSGRSKINKSEIARKLNWYFAKPDKDGFKRPDDTKVQRCIDTLIVDKLLSQNQVGIHLTKEGKEVVKNIDSLLGW